MGSFSEKDEDSRFFDALESIVQESDPVPDSPCANYDIWTNVPQSVGERRREFISKMGLISDDEENSVDSVERDSLDSVEGNSLDLDSLDRIVEDSEAELLTSCVEDDSSSSASSFDLPNEKLPKIRVGGQFESSARRSRRQRSVEFNNSSTGTPRILELVKERMLTRLRSMSCIITKTDENDDISESDHLHDSESRTAHRVRVRHSRRKVKELSALFLGQDIQAHEGSILTMKFSLDGQYLATAGVDGSVKVWQVVEDERRDIINIPDGDPSCVYLSVNHLSELAPLSDKEKTGNLKRTPNSACIVFPQKIFRILETPLHVFEGHEGEILDLSWSNDNCLISCSVDTTARLWKIGTDQCVKVFYHTDYVTCVHFCPVNDDLFISGSLDGKVRMWSINGCKVVDWIETRDIVTAVSYRPNGKGGIIGSITGTCSFFNVSDNQFQMESQMCLSNSKKSLCKRITGFQFLPQDPTKVLVSRADSHVKIIDGMNVVRKYIGPRLGGNNIYASLTSDGKHIVSACEDSNIYVFDCTIDENASLPKVIRSSECFSCDASVALTWSGLKSSSSLPFSSSSTRFSLSNEFPVDSNSRGSATWPEEKLPKSSPRALSSSMGKSQFKLFKASCQNSLNANAWGLIIVTAGWDGRIKTFHNYGLPLPV